MAKTKLKIGSVDYERIFNWEGGMNDAVSAALLDAKESPLLHNASLDEKGTLGCRSGSEERYAEDISSGSVVGMGSFYKSDGTSRFLIATDDGKLFVDTPHVINKLSTQAELQAGESHNLYINSDGKIVPYIFRDNFESGNLGKWTVDGWSVQNIVKITGDYSAKGTGAEKTLKYKLDRNVTDLHIKCKMRFPSTSERNSIFATSGSARAQLFVAKEDGTFQYNNGSFTEFEGNAPNRLTLNQSNVETGTTGFSAINGATLTRVTTEHWQGEASLRVQTDADKEGVSVANGTQKAGSYTFSVYLKGTGKVYLTITDGTTTQDGLAITLTSTWTRYTVTGTMGNKVVTCQIRQSGTGTADFYADGLQLESGSATTFKESSFYVANTDYAIEIVLSGGKYWVYRDGSCITPSGIGLKDTSGNAITQVSEIVFETGYTSTSGTMYLDDVEIKPSAPVFTRNSAKYQSNGTEVAAETPTYEAGVFNNGVHMEESTTNLLTANQSSIEMDTIGFVATAPGITISRDITEHWHGSASLKVETPGVYAFEGFYAGGVSGLSGQVFTASAWVKAPNGVEMDVMIRREGTTNLTRELFTATGVWQRVSMTLILDANTTDLRIYIRTGNAAQTITFYVDGLAIEAKAYATSWTLGGTTRQPDSLLETLPQPLPDEWFYATAWKPDQASVIDRTNGIILAELYYDVNNRYYMGYSPVDDKFFLAKFYGGTYIDMFSATVSFSAGDTIAFAATQLTQAHGDLTAGMHLWFRINSGEVVHVSNTDTNLPTAPTKVYIGCYNIAGYEANGVIDGVKLIDIVATEALGTTINEAWAEGFLTAETAPAADEATLLLCNFDDTIEPDDTKGGLWISPAIDVSSATDKANGTAALTTETPGTTSVSMKSRSGPSNTGPWTEWIAVEVGGIMKHTPDSFVQILVLESTSATDEPSASSLVVSFDGEASATQLASDFTQGGSFYFDTLLDYCVVVNGIDTPRKYDGTTLSTLGGSPPHSQLVAVHKNRMWFVVGSRLYFSDLLDIETWPVLNFIDISPNDGDYITALKQVSDYLVITKRHSTWILSGEGTNTFAVKRIHPNRGAYAPRSLAMVNDMLCFVSDDGIYFSDLVQAVLISERVKDYWNTLNSRRFNQAACWHADHKLYVAVPSSNSLVNDRVIVYDTLRQCFVGIIPNWNVSCFAEFREGGKKIDLYGHSDKGQVSQIDIGYSDNGVAIPFLWKSREMNFGASEILKRWNQIFIDVVPAATDVTLQVTFFVDGVAKGPMPLTIPGDTTGLIHNIRALASVAGVVEGRRLAIQIEQNVLNDPVSIHGISIEYMVKGLKPSVYA